MYHGKFCRVIEKVFGLVNLRTPVNIFNHTANIKKENRNKGEYEIFNNNLTIQKAIKEACPARQYVVNNYVFLFFFFAAGNKIVFSIKRYPAEFG